MNFEKKKFIGVELEFRDIPSLKQKLLLFDHLALGFLNYPRSSDEDNLRKYDFCYSLVDKGLITITLQDVPKGRIPSQTFISFFKSLGLKDGEIERAMKTALRDPYGFTEVILLMSGPLKTYELKSRAYAHMVGMLMKADAYPIIPTSDPLFIKDEKSASNVLHIVLKNIPVVSPQMSWKSILDSRTDAELRTKFLNFRRWISQLGEGNRSSQEITQELEYLTHEYEKYMRIQKMKICPGVLETFITLTTDTIEDLLKFRWSNIAKKLFTLKHRKLELLEAEMNAPGKEIAYVLNLRNRQQEVGNALDGIEKL